jgi:RNA polymerase sigma-70 factor (ECF subfamily)
VAAGAAGGGVWERDPADRVTLDESVSYALLALLEQLSPAERTAFVLHDIFEVPFGEVAEIVGRSPDAVRQLASRAPRHVAERRPRFEATRAEHESAVHTFARAIAEGDLDGLLAVLDPEVVWTSDGGGHAIAARRPLHGAERLARAWLALRRKPAIVANPTPIDVNGRLGLQVVGTDGNDAVVAFLVVGGRIARIDGVRNPAKLRRLRSQQGDRGQMAAPSLDEHRLDEPTRHLVPQKTFGVPGEAEVVEPDVEVHEVGWPGARSRVC